MLTLKTVTPETPTTLLKRFEDAIAGKGTGKQIDTWMKVKSGPHAGRFTHISDRQKDDAYFSVSQGKDELHFSIHYPGEKKPTGWDYTYAYYHGHLSETFIYHFASFFSTSTATAKPYVPPKPAAKTAAKPA
jgi:hypothetical protein